MALSTRQMDRAMDEHFGFEAADDIEGVVSTLSADVIHDIVGWPGGPTVGRDQARPFYENLFADLADGQVRCVRRLYGENFLVDESIWHGRAPGRPFARAAELDLGSAGLSRRGQHLDGPAAELERLARPRRLERRDRLAHARRSFGRVDAEHGELVGDVAASEAEVEATAADQVDDRRVRRSGRPDEPHRMLVGVPLAEERLDLPGDSPAVDLGQQHRPVRLEVWLKGV